MFIAAPIPAIAPQPSRPTTAGSASGIDPGSFAFVHNGFVCEGTGTKAAVNGVPSGKVMGCEALWVSKRYHGGNLALRMGVSEIEARDLMRRLHELFPTFVEWADANVHAGQLCGYLSTVFGWTLTTEGERPNTLRNFVVQANAAEMLRLAASLTTEHGIAVFGPVHDALLVEGGIDEIEDVVAAVRIDMVAASRSVLDGVGINVEAEIVRYPDRYMDERGRVTWDLVMGLLGGHQGG